MSRAKPQPGDLEAARPLACPLCDGKEIETRPPSSVNTSKGRGASVVLVCKHCGSVAGAVLVRTSPGCAEAPAAGEQGDLP